MNGLRISILAFTVMAVATASEVEFSTPTFSAFHEFGKFEKGESDATIPIKDQWVHRSGAWMSFSIRKNERLGLDATIGGVYWNYTKEEEGDRESLVRHFGASVPKLNVSYIWGDPEDPALSLNGGVFPYKYNPHAQNLGEYMFRTGVYPGWIMTGGLAYVESNKAQLNGVVLKHRMAESFTHDLILNLETQIIPFYDLHVTYMGRFNAGDVLTLGGGVQFARLIPARPGKTNPDVFQNRYFNLGGDDYVDRRAYYQQLLSGARRTGADTTFALQGLAIADSINRMDGLIRHIDDIGTSRTDSLALRDSVAAELAGFDFDHFKAVGIKPMVHFAFDPKPLLGLDVFGPADLILYGEAALLGVKDYPVYYANRAERIPMMVGFNFPAFGLLDVLAIEVEYYGSKNDNSTFDVMQSGYPRPTDPRKNGYVPEEFTDDDVKWSVFAKRSIIDGFYLAALVARDHARGQEFNLRGRSDWPVFREPGHWYWMVKLVANI